LSTPAGSRRKLRKNNLLSDQTAQALGLGSDPTVDDALYRLRNAGTVTDTAGNSYVMEIDPLFLKIPAPEADAPFVKWTTAANVAYNDDYICAWVQGTSNNYSIRLYDWNYNILHTIVLTAFSNFNKVVYFDDDCFIVRGNPNSYLYSWDTAKSPFTISGISMPLQMLTREGDFLYAGLQDISIGSTAMTGAKYNVKDWATIYNISRGAGIYSRATGDGQIYKNDKLYVLLTLTEKSTSPYTIALGTWNLPNGGISATTLLTTATSLYVDCAAFDAHPDNPSPKMYYSVFAASYNRIYEVDVVNAQQRQVYQGTSDQTNGRISNMLLIDNGALAIVEGGTSNSAIFKIINLSTLAVTHVASLVGASSSSGGVAYGRLSHKAVIAPSNRDRFVNLEKDISFHYTSLTRQSGFATGSYPANFIDGTFYTPLFFNNSAPITKLLFYNGGVADLARPDGYILTALRRA
jgi:hypothetical protein